MQSYFVQALQSCSLASIQDALLRKLGSDPTSLQCKLFLLDSIARSILLTENAPTPTSKTTGHAAAFTSASPQKLLSSLQQLLAAASPSAPQPYPAAFTLLGQAFVHRLLPSLAKTSSRDSRVPSASGAQPDAGLSSESTRTITSITLLLQSVAVANPALAALATEAAACVQQLVLESSAGSELGKGLSTQTSPVRTSSGSTDNASSDAVPFSWKKLMKLPESSAALQRLTSAELLALHSIESEATFTIMHLADTALAWERKVELFIAFLRLRASSNAEDQSASEPPPNPASYESALLELFLAAAAACAAVTSAAQNTNPLPGARNGLALWRSVLCSVLPSLFVSAGDSSPAADISSSDFAAQQHELVLASFREELTSVRWSAVLHALFVVGASPLRICETDSQAKPTTQAAADDGDSEQATIAAPNAAKVRALLTRSLSEKGLIDEATASSIGTAHGFEQELYCLEASLHADAASQGSSLQQLLESKLTAEEPSQLLQRLLSDYGAQHTASTSIVTQLCDSISARELETAATWARALSETCTMLDVIAVHAAPLRLCDALAAWLDSGELGHHGEESTTVGALILFAQLLRRRYQMQSVTQSRLLTEVLRSSAAAHPLKTLPKGAQELVDRWLTALFGSEGISDDLLRDSPPTTLLRLAPTLFQQSIAACQHGMLDLDALRSGLTYFLEDPLSYTLPGALQWLVREIRRMALLASDDTAHSRLILTEVLGMLIDSEKCPTAVCNLVAADLLELRFDPLYAASVKGVSTSISASNLRKKMVGSQHDLARIPPSLLLQQLLSLQVEGAAAIPSLLTRSQDPLNATFEDALASCQDAFCSGAPLHARTVASILAASVLVTGTLRSLTLALARSKDRKLHINSAIALLAALRFVADSPLEGLEQSLDDASLLLAYIFSRQRGRAEWSHDQVRPLLAISKSRAFSNLKSWRAIEHALTAPSAAFV